MSDIDRFTPAFPKSRFDESIASYAMMSLSELKDTTRVVAFGEKALAANPNNLAALLLLAGTFVEDPKPGGVAKASPMRRGQSSRPRRMPRTRTVRANFLAESPTPLWATPT